MPLPCLFVTRPLNAEILSSVFDVTFSPNKTSLIGQYDAHNSELLCAFTCCRRPKLQTVTVIVGFTEVKLPASLVYTQERALRPPHQPKHPQEALSLLPTALDGELDVDRNVKYPYVHRSVNPSKKYHANKYW